MLKKKINTYLVLIFAFILLVLITAFIIEYKMGHQPCVLCLYERIPYIFSVIIITNIFIFKKYEKISFLILSILFLSGAFLAFYHFGIEQGYFSELSICKTKNISESISKEELLNQLSQSIVSCKDVSIRILNLSLATINMIFSFFLSLIFLRLFFLLR